MKMWACGGAAVPPTVIYEAEDAGIPSFRLYGLSELPTVTLSNRMLPLELRAETDGVVAPGVEVVAIGQDGRVVPTGEEGELRVRGPERMLGYFDHRANEGVLDADGWIMTGDIGKVTEQGAIEITGRLKDIINRGGEKISAREIEDILVGHPSIAQAAVVPCPDERFGEVPVAFVVLSAEGGYSSDDLVGYLRERGLPNQKLPVKWLPIDAMPATASGKIKKTELVRQIPA
jgi:acyl-CoA synthetase